MIKRMICAAVLASVMSAAAFANGESVKREDWTINANTTQLSKCLRLSSSQMSEVESISEYFAYRMQVAAASSEAKQGKRLRQAVYSNLRLMRDVLSEEQYRKYVSVLNVTLRNKGLDCYLVKD